MSSYIPINKFGLEDNIRISYKNKIINDIKSINIFIQKNKDSIISLRTSDLHPDFIFNKIILLTENIKVKNDILCSLEKRLKDTEDGLLDEEIENEIKHNILNASNKTIITKKKKDDIKFVSIEDKNKLDIFIKKEKITTRNNKYEIKTFNSSYKYFCKINEKFPMYMLEKLRNMPNNKGYIFRDSWFMGEQQADNSGIITMFEKKYNEKDVLYIHEYTNVEHLIFKKIGNNRKFLFSRQNKNRLII